LPQVRQKEPARCWLLFFLWRKDPIGSMTSLLDMLAELGMVLTIGAVLFSHHRFR